MSTEENKAIVRQYLEELFTHGNLAIADELVASHYVNHQVSSDVSRGPEVDKQAAASNRSIFPDCRITIHDMLADADRVMARVSMAGTQQGDIQTPIGSIPATGKRTVFDAVLIFRLADGKLTESWSVFDTMGALQQAGAIVAIQ
jgi:predicted ester cyclase